MRPFGEEISGDRYLSNPSPERDARFRHQAQDRYYQLVKWLEEVDPFTLRNLYLKSISFSRGPDSPAQIGLVLPWRFVDNQAGNWTHPLRHFHIVFFGEHRETRGGSFVTDLEQRGDKKIKVSYIFLYQALDKSGQTDGLLSRLRSREIRSTFIHEYIHFLDSQRYKRTFKHAPAQVVGFSNYYLSPVEFNAYYLQGFQRLEEDFDDRMLKMTPESMVAWLRRSKEMGILVESASKIENILLSSAKLLIWDEILFNLPSHWSYDYLKYLRKDPRMWKRYLKRLRIDFEVWREPHLKIIQQFEDLLETTVLELAGKGLFSLKYDTE